MIVPAGHKVLIRIKPIEEKTDWGFDLSTINKDVEARATTEGVVEALGETAYLKVDDGRKWVQPGDKVLYGKYAGMMVEDPATKDIFVVVHDVDIVAILRD